MKNLTVENVYTRHGAKELTRKHFWKLTAMLLIVFVTSFALTWGGTFLLAKATGMPIATAMNTSAGSFSVSAQIAPYNQLSMEKTVIPFFVGYAVLMLLVSILGGGLGMGLTSAMLDICRNQEKVKIRQIFSRMRYCFKCFLLGLWIGFKTLLWTLPGLVLLFFVTGGILVAGDPHTMQVTEATAAALSLLPLVMMVIIFALVIPAVLRYYLSPFVLADEPSTGVFDCVKKSKAMMKGHKWQCFKLTIPLYLACYAIMLGIVLVLGVVMFVLGETALQTKAYEILMLVLPAVLCVMILILALAYGIRASLCYCLFYLKRKGEMPAIPPEEEERIVCWQPGAEQTPGEPVANGSDEHIACWQPGEEKKDED